MNRRVLALPPVGAFLAATSSFPTVSFGRGSGENERHVLLFLMASDTSDRLHPLPAVSDGLTVKYSLLPIRRDCISTQGSS